MTAYKCQKPGKDRSEQIKVLLVFPKVGAEAKNMSLHLPIGLIYLASYLQDYSVAIYDQRVDDVDVFYRLLDEDPVCVGFSIMTGIQIKYALELAQIAKYKNIPTVFGGVHPTILPEQTQKDERVDLVVAGEGEVAFRTLIEKLASKQNTEKIFRGIHVDLNTINMRALDLLNVENYIHSAMLEGRSLPFSFSRGCPFKCTFCCNPVISNSQWRAMDVDIAIDQLNQLVDKYNLDGIAFFDENLTANPKILKHLAESIDGRFTWWAQSRANALLKYDLSFLQEMGLHRISCGIESGSPKILKQIGKGETVEEYIEANRNLAKTGIHSWYNYIVGFPEETIEDVKLTLNLALQILDENEKANNSTFYLLSPYPGTEIGEKYFKSSFPSTLEGWIDFDRFNFSTSWHPPDRVQLYSRICFSSKFVGRRLSSVFPEDEELKQLIAVFTEKWHEFSFFNDREWEELESWGWRILKRFFGDNAF